jgi:hypothetical protein
MRDDARQEEGPRGIRLGIWLAVLGVVFLGILAGTHPRRAATRLPTEVIKTPTETAGHDATPALTAEQATRLARDLANERAKALHGGEVFAATAAARWEGDRWTWRDRRGYGPVDIEATVDFAADGSARHVEVILLDSRATFEFLKYRIR